MRILILLILISNVCFGQKVETGVSLKIFNNTEQDCIVKVYQQSNQSDQAEKIFLTLGAIDSLKVGTSVDLILPDFYRGYFLSINAELDKGGSTRSIIIPTRKGQTSYQIPIDIPDKKVIVGGDPEVIKNAMQYEPSKFTISENYSLADLFNGLFGGLVIYKMDKDGKIKIINTITPVQLGTRQESRFGNNSDKKTMILSKDQSASANVSIPSTAGMSLDWSSADLFKIEVIYKNAGPILWSPNAEMIDITTKFKKLPPDRLSFIGEIFSKDSTLKMAQVDNAYIFEAISFDLVKYTKLTATSIIDGNVFFSANGNYSLSNEESQKQVIGSFMKGAWWNNDYTALLNHAKKIYLNEKEIELGEKKTSQEIKDIYNSLKIVNPDLPEFTTKEKAIEEIKKLNQSIVVKEEDIKKNPDVVVVETENVIKEDDI